MYAYTYSLCHFSLNTVCGFRCGYFPMENSSVMKRAYLCQITHKLCETNFSHCQDSSIWSSVLFCTFFSIHEFHTCIYVLPHLTSLSLCFFPPAYIYFRYMSRVRLHLVTIIVSSTFSSPRCSGLLHVHTVWPFVACSSPNPTDGNFVLFSVRAPVPCFTLRLIIPPSPTWFAPLEF